MRLQPLRRPARGRKHEPSTPGVARQSRGGRVRPHPAGPQTARAGRRIRSPARTAAPARPPTTRARPSFRTGRDDPGLVDRLHGQEEGPPFGLGLACFRAWGLPQRDWQRLLPRELSGLDESRRESFRFRQLFHRRRQEPFRADGLRLDIEVQFPPSSHTTVVVDHPASSRALVAQQRPQLLTARGRASPAPVPPRQAHRPRRTQAGSRGVRGALRVEVPSGL